MTPVGHDLHRRLTAASAPGTSGWVGLRRTALALFRLLRLALTILVHGRDAGAPGRGKDGLHVQPLLDMPADDEQVVVLTRAAEASGIDLQDFVLESALAVAERVVAARRRSGAPPLAHHRSALRLVDEPTAPASRRTRAAGAGGSDGPRGGQTAVRRSSGAPA